MKQILLLILILPLAAFPQNTSAIKWWDPASNDFPVIEGQAWTKEVSAPYDRLPARAEGNVREAVWNLSRHSAGLMIRFFSNAENIHVRYTVNGNHAMPHMPATGVSGVDLYAIDAEGKEFWCRGRYLFKDTITYHFGTLNPNDRFHQQGREYRLYLPLYNSVSWLEIGVEEGNIFTPLPVRMDKPVVVYGTSIAHGACASRPGMAWTGILSRKLDRPLINLAFSGNGRLEPEVTALLTEIDARVFILDCLPNLVPQRFTSEDVYQRILASVRTLRSRHPEVPILLAEHAGYSDGGVSPERMDAYTSVNETLTRALADLKAEGIQGLYYISMEDFALGLDGTVDGTHPNDLGMQRYAEGYEKILRKILHEPRGEHSTTQAVTQYREPGNYDWQSRHREIIKLNHEEPPRVLFIGNSITHFWGGNPVGPHRTGADSWDKFLEPEGVRNLGYGWDRVENVLWRVYHGEIDGFEANKIVINIGTNNLHLNTDEEILAGWEMLLQAIQVRQPKAEIFMLGIYPRRNHEARVKTINEKMARLAGNMNIGFSDPGKIFLDEEGKINEKMFYDGLHPNAEGYQKLGPLIKELITR